jgi:hypothetical protein
LSFLQRGLKEEEEEKLKFEFSGSRFSILRGSERKQSISSKLRF